MRDTTTAIADSYRQAGWYRYLRIRGTCSIPICTADRTSPPTQDPAERLRGDGVRRTKGTTDAE